MISYKNLINKFTNIKLVNNTFKKFRNKFIILYYHGVIEDNDMKKINGPNKHLFVPKSYFIEQMSFLEKNNINVISINEFRYNPDFKIGDTVEVIIDQKENKTGQLVLSHKKARAREAWDKALPKASGCIVSGAAMTWAAVICTSVFAKE